MLEEFAIAFISNEPTPYRNALLKRLSREVPGINLHCLFTNAEGSVSMPWQQDTNGLKTKYFASGLVPGAGGINRSFRLYREIVGYVQENQIQMIILNGYGDSCRLLLASWAAKKCIPLLVRGDSNIFDERGKPFWKIWLKRKMLTHLMSRVAGVLPMGVAGQAYFRFYTNHNLPTFLCPYEADYSLWSNHEVNAKKLICERFRWNDATRRRFLFSGRFVDVKCADIAIKAFCQIAAERSNWDLVLAGDGPLRDQLKSLVPTDLRDRVHWLGFMQSAELASVYHNCHLLVHPARIEPWGLIINEAVAAGLPIVTTNVVGAALELVRHNVNGQLVDPDCLSAFTNALLIASEHETIVRYRANCSLVLDEWYLRSDPVVGVTNAINYFYPARTKQGFERA